MNELINKMFFWCGIFLFDSKKKEYGGFNHFIAGKIFRWKLDYLQLSITYKIRFLFKYEDDNYFYDGYHNIIQVGCFRASFGTL